MQLEEGKVYFLVKSELFSKTITASAVTGVAGGKFSDSVLESSTYQNGSSKINFTSRLLSQFFIIRSQPFIAVCQTSCGVKQSSSVCFRCCVPISSVGATCQVDACNGLRKPEQFLWVFCQNIRASKYFVVELSVSCLFSNQYFSEENHCLTFY